MIDSSRILVILNPVAGKGKAGERLPEIERLLASHGLAFDLKRTEAPGHATRIAESVDADAYPVVVAAGGDGTVNETVNGLMAAKAMGKRVPALGVLSVGRGNDFSYGADLPGELEGCISVLARDVRRPLDVGLVKGGDFPDGKYFANGIGVGFDTIVGLEAAKMKHVHGAMAYVFGALRTFIMFPEAPEVKISWEDAFMSIASHQISIMNGKRMGGTFFMAPWAENHDGRLELCMAGRMNRREMVDLMIRYTKGSQVGHPKITTASAAHFRIESPKGGLVVHADGETVCIDGKALDVECVPGALEIVCDPGRVERERAAAQPGMASKATTRG